VDGIRKIVEDAGFELVLLEKYADPNDLLKAVANVDALIVRSDKVTRDVIDAAKNLKNLWFVLAPDTTSRFGCLHSQKVLLP